ncbi:MAG: hypothetical protein U5K76_04665 [Woeseiaceae bacterium]|nr:hypothetical protein [Woeseiaceae bacterium]
MTETDRRKFRGVAWHPLARKWLYKRFIDANEQAEQAARTKRRGTYGPAGQSVSGMEMRRLGMTEEQR